MLIDINNTGKKHGCTTDIGCYSFLKELDTMRLRNYQVCGSYVNQQHKDRWAQLVKYKH